MTTRSFSQRVEEILVCINRIKINEQYLSEAEAIGNSELFDMAFDAILMNLLVIGENVKASFDQFTQDYPSIPWASIAKLRDRIAHHYHHVDSREIQAAIDEPLQQLLNALTR